VPGIVEGEDPGTSGFQFDVFVAGDRPAEVPEIDVELFVDRLRFMGIDETLVAEAERRLRADAGAGMRWIHDRLEELQPPRRPPACDCGETLLDVAWRGRATIRCSACGSRWGVEVIDEDTESIWRIDGPTQEWRDAHPVEEADRYGEFPPEDVLRDGLPPLPDGIEPGAFFPVATWEGGRHAAVLYVHRLAPGEFDLPGDQYEDETEHLVLDQDGQWKNAGSGGGCWVNVFAPPSALLEKYGVLSTGTTGSGEGDDAVFFTGGLCSRAVAAVETNDALGRRTFPIDPGRPFYVVGVHGGGQVRILDGHQETVRGPRGEPLEFRLND